MRRILLIIFAVSLLSITSVFAQDNATPRLDVIGVAYHDNTKVNNDAQNGENTDTGTLQLLVKNIGSQDYVTEDQGFPITVTVKPFQCNENQAGDDSATETQELNGTATFTGTLKPNAVALVDVKFEGCDNPLSDLTIYNVTVNHPTEESPTEFILYRNLNATQIEFDTSTKYFVGSEIALDITVENKDTQQAYPYNNNQIYYRVDFQFVPDIEGANNQTAELSWSIIEPLNIEIGARDSETVTLTTSDINRGEYNRYVVQFGEKETLEQGQSYTSTVVSQKPSSNLIINSNLPPELEELFAAIALFAGMMLVMAVATEIVVDTLRLAIGLKRKTSAVEAISQLQKELPGALAELGVSAEKRVTLRYLTDSVKTELVDNTVKIETLVKTLKDKPSYKDIVVVLHNLGEILADDLKVSFTDQGAVVVYPPSAGNIPDLAVKWYEQFCDMLDSALSEVLKATTNTFTVTFGEIASDQHKVEFEKDLTRLLSEHLVGPLRQKSDDLRSQAANWSSADIEDNLTTWLNKTVGEIKDDFEQLIRELAKLVQEETIQRLTEWLDNQANKNIVRFKIEFDKLLEGELGKELDYIGIDKTQRNKLVKRVENIARDAAVESIREVVKEIQKRREDIQSTIMSLLQFPMLDLINFNENGDTQATKRERFYFEWPDRFWQNWMFLITFLICIIVLPVYMALTFSTDSNLYNMPLIIVLAVMVAVVGLARAFFVWKNLGESSPPYRKILLFSNTSGKELDKHYPNNLNPVKDWLHAFLAFFLQFAISGVVLFFVMLVHTDLEQQIPDSTDRIWDIVITLAVMFAINFVIYNRISRSRTFAREIENMNVINAPAHIAKIEDVHADEEAARIRAIRLISAFVGVFLAVIMQVDSADLLREAIPAFASTLDSTQLPLLHAYGITPGILLTGLAASAGATFWHDVLDRMQIAKAKGEQITKAIQDVREQLNS